MALETTSKELFATTKNLRSNWHDVQSIWKDSVSKEFGRDCIDPFLANLESLHSALDDLNVAIKQTKRILANK
jgi:hypothetical protein